MSLTANEFMKKFNQFPDVSLTLFNEEGETYAAGEIETLIHKKDTVRIRWAMAEPMTNTLPLTHAVLHRGKKVWDVFSIKPVHNDEATSLEITYGR